MNNLISTEKALKHWLKNKVAVTTATVVGFLIMGSVSFGANYTKTQEINNGQNFTLKENEIIEINEKFGTGIFAKDSFKITLEKGSNINVQGFETTDGIFVNNVNAVSSIENYGNIKSTVRGGGSASAIAVQGNITADLTITNKEGATLETDYIKGDGIGARAVVDLNPNREKNASKVEFINEGTIIVSKGTAVALTGNSIVKNFGTIILNDTESSAIKNNTDSIKNVESTGTIIVKGADKNFDVNSLFTGKTGVEHLGAIQDDKGNSLENKNSIYLSGELNTKVINDKGNSFKSSVTLGKDKATKINTSSSEAIKLKSLNIIGKVDLIKSTITPNNNNISIENTTVNIGKDGLLNANGINLSITGNNVNTFENGIAVNLTNSSTLNLKDVSFNGGISSDNNENKLNVSGNTYINGEIGVKNINVGTGTKAVGSDKLTLSSDSSFTKATTLTNNTTGTTIFIIDKDGKNALQNSTDAVTINGNIDFDTTNLTTDQDVHLNGKNDTIKHTINKYQDKTTGVYTTKLDTANNILHVTYNKSLFADARLNTVNNGAQMVNGNFSQVTSEREGQMDKIYSGSIYAETIRAAYDNLKLNEGTILSLSNNVKAGEFTAEGRAIYNKDEYKRDGIVGKYDVENETSGLLASLEYGVNDTTKTGLVFAGSKQDLDVTGGKADGDLFYLGFYGVKSLGNYDLTAGLGYQLGKYDATNTAANVVGKDKYDTKALSGYVQAKYLGDLGDGLSIQPKVKLGYTHLKQDSAKDSYFGLTDTDVTTFDTELGADLVKTVQLEKSKVDVKFGTAFVKTFGDTDKEFKGQFFGANTASNQFGVHGGELSENVLKFNLGAEVANENGFFYNGGFTYEFGSEDMKSYGVNVGAGYRF
ncbi:autotransporter outer membrane beta-barrel domain-containing protein [Fusobacterium sp. SYSU M8D902]|uniref:autotransporter family protein n=1 Tax=Fusobacterium sp. SYSU M8D902 TaxID=3159562 RepID=UPI0032E42CDA